MQGIEKKRYWRNRKDSLWKRRDKLKKKG